MKAVFLCKAIKSVSHGQENLNHDMFLVMEVKDGIVGRRHKIMFNSY